MGFGIFLGIVGVLAAVFIGVKCAVHYSERKEERAERKKQKEELKKDKEKYLLEEDLFNPEISLPYEEKTTRRYEPKNRENDDHWLDR